MEQFREKIKIDNLITAISAFVLAIFCFLSAYSEFVSPILPVPHGDSHWQSMWRGFISGAACALLAFMIFALVRGIRALRSDKYLKKLYVESNDERAIKIWSSARAAAYQVCLIAGLVAVVVSGYFSMTVSITILACILFASVAGLLFKLYYSKKF